MIYTTNVCDFCGNQNEINADDNQFRITFSTQSIQEYIDRRSQYGIKEYDGTFCNKDCMTSYLKQHLNINGTMKIKKDEFDKEEDESVLF